MKKKKVRRPRLFIGSSEESLDYAYAIQQDLDDDAEVTVWKQGIFQLTKTSVESLIKALDRSDFAVFVFAPNDALRLRQKKYAAVRDNVVFELGLFMGKLGRQRTFIVVPKTSEHLRIPTDLTGVTLGKFEPNRKDKNLEAAFGPFCNAVRGQIRRRGTQFSRSGPTAKRISRPKGDLVVIEATYGIQDQHVDATKPLNAAITDSKLHIYAGNQLVGDPCPNTPKELSVRYRYKNQEFVKVVGEGAVLDLP
jgi:hypothetical protein